MTDREVNLRFTATDDASKTIDGIADDLDELEDGADITIDADTREAESNIARFGREVDDLTDDARELRITFKEKTLQNQIRSTLRQLENLEDPVEIQLATDKLEQTQADLRELEKLAGEKYEIEIDADPQRNAARAADDIDGIRQKGEGLQSAIPAIRGFGDEVGGAAASAGIAGQAVADLGDFALIASEQFAPAGSKIQGFATKVGTALGAAGLAGAFAGIGVSIVQVALPAIQKFLGGQDDLTEATEEATERILDQAGALDLYETQLDRLGRGGSVIDAVLGGDPEQVTKVNRALADTGLELEDLAFSLEATEEERADLFEGLLRSEGVAESSARKFAELAAAGDTTAGSLLKLGVDGGFTLEELGLLEGEVGDLVNQLSLVAQQTGIVDLEEAFRNATAELNVLGEISDETYDQVRNGTLSAITAYQRWEDQTRRQENAEKAVESAAGRTKRAVEQTGTTGVAAMGDLEGASGDAEDALGEVEGAVEDVIDELGELEGTLDRDISWERWRERNSAALEQLDTDVGLSKLEVLEYQAGIIDAAEELGNVPPSVVTELVAQFDDGATREEIERTERILQYWADRSPIVFDIQYRNTVIPGTSIRIDENGNLIPGQTANQFSSGGNTNVTVNMPAGADGRDVTRAVARWTRLNGRS